MINEIPTPRKCYSKYNLAVYNFKCPVCERVSKSNKCLADHIFHRNWKDKKHRELAQKLKLESKENFLKKVKGMCPICNKLVTRNLGNHFRLMRNSEHKLFLAHQTKIAVSLFQRGYSPKDIENDERVYLTHKVVLKRIIDKLGNDKVIEISKEIFKRKREAYWNTFSAEERKQKMIPIYEAEWKNLTSEQRRKHPWVIAGRRASLESSIKGSKNQKYAYELLKNRVPRYNWVYNYALNENWQIDIASPEYKIFIEWDGRHHRIPIYGESYLKNRKNRDCIKNRIIVEQINGTLIRINDEGKFDRRFVEEKVGKIIRLLSEVIKKELVLL